MSDDNKGTEENTVTAIDSADRLLLLMEKIERVAEATKVNNLLACDSALYSAFEPIAGELEFSDYAELRNHFVLLCDRVIRDIESINFKNPRTKERWKEAVKKASKVFDANNFALKCRDVFSKHFSRLVYERLEDASERLQNLNRTETLQDDLVDALEAARTAMNAYEENGTIPEELNRILKHYLNQMEQAYRYYDDFGDEAFWKTYKELFATFVQVHPVIMPEDTSEEAQKAVQEAVGKMRNKMYYGLNALAITANVSAIAASGLTILQIAN